MAEHNKIGEIGEKLTKTFLMKHGFKVLETNYRGKYGEIDIVAKKDNRLRFVEVKTIKVRGVGETEYLKVVPTDNLTRDKWRHIAISAEGYLKHRAVTHETRWQIDLACVYLDTETRQGRVVLMENILKE